MINMIVEYSFCFCQSENIVKNGRNVCDNQQYRCKDCGACKVLEPVVQYRDERKEEIMRAYQERSSLRGMFNHYLKFCRKQKKSLTVAVLAVIIRRSFESICLVVNRS